MGLFSRGERQTGKERRQYRDHLAELDVLLEDGLDRLGSAIAAMAARGQIDQRAIWEQAARLSSIEDEIRLVERGIQERLTRSQLEQLARTELGGGDPESGTATSVSPADSTTGSDETAEHPRTQQPPG